MEYPPPDLGPGYQVVQRLGKGASGEVYRAENLALQRTEAIDVCAGHRR